MRIGFIGAGRIGGNAARLYVQAGHEVLLSFSRDAAALQERAAGLGQSARAGTPAEAAAFGEVVFLSVPWPLVGDAVAAAGGLDGRIVIDTTNQFTPDGLADLPAGRTAAQVNQERMRGARLVKAYNTLTSGFQVQAAGREGPDRVVMFMCGDDTEAKRTVGGLIEDSGFTPFDLGGLADAAPMEAPRRPGAVYGEELHLDEARDYAARLR
jgi:predicted dinucleotide-binding enzyme